MSSSSNTFSPSSAQNTSVDQQANNAKKDHGEQEFHHDAQTQHRSQWRIARRCVQIGILLLFISPLLVSGWLPLGLTSGGDDVITIPAELPFYGSLSSSSVLGINVLDPFGVLQVIVASRSVTADLLLFALPVLLVYGLIRGRAFCGWVCPANLFLEGIDFLRKKLKIQVKEQAIPRHTKIAVAVAVLVLSAALSFPIFEAFSPISFINKGILFGSTVGAVTFGAIVVTELFWGHRVWCRSICPLGGFYQVLGRVGQVNVHIDQTACIHCDRCKTACLASPEILDPVLNNETTLVKAGDCMACGMCIDACPTSALAMKIGRFERSQD